MTHMRESPKQSWPCLPRVAAAALVTLGVFIGVFA